MNHFPAVRVDAPLPAWGRTSILGWTRPSHLSISDIRRHTRSNDTVTLLVPTTRRSTLGDRAFPVAAARAWNALPARVRSAPSLSIFRCQLKTCLFCVYHFQNNLNDYCNSDLTFHTRFLSHFILFLYSGSPRTVVVSRRRRLLTNTSC